MSKQDLIDRGTCPECYYGCYEHAPTCERRTVVHAAAVFNHTEQPKILNTRHGDPRFYALLEEIAALHSSKSHDYTPAGDPLANFKRAERFGVPAWKGTLIRMGDKFGRLEQLGGSEKTPANESMRDTLIDLAVYALLCVLLLDDAG